ncbi:hypothetical protein EDD21DRAFT_393397 [Dissophora ornata]|nr:Nicotinamide/nicotinic acid mononucleotide adenylyltransferase 1 [Dissophora ornata]KAI8594550.1 hypothetical protein EDD21DRAFT_393397 [Dissophora ornata]
MLEGARETMEKTGNVMILGGFISPSHDSYVGQKLSGEKLLLDSTKRAELCELQTRDSDWLDVDRWESNQSQFMVYSKVASRLQKFVEESCRLMLQNKIKTLDGSDPDPCETIRVVYVCGADFVLRTGAVNLNGGIAVVDRPVSFNRRSSFLLPSPGDAKPAPLTSQVITQAENTAEELVRGKVVEERVIGKLNESYGDAWEEFLANKFWWVSARGSPDSEDISSTLIRERIEGNQSCDGLLHPAVSKRVLEWSQNAA